MIFEYVKQKVDSAVVFMADRFHPFTIQCPVFARDPDILCLYILVLEPFGPPVQIVLFVKNLCAGYR